MEDNAEYAAEDSGLDHASVRIYSLPYCTALSLRNSRRLWKKLKDMAFAGCSTAPNIETNYQSESRVNHQNLQNELWNTVFAGI